MRVDKLEPFNNMRRNVVSKLSNVGCSPEILKKYINSIFWKCYQDKCTGEKCPFLLSLTNHDYIKKSKRNVKTNTYS